MKQTKLWMVLAIAEFLVIIGILLFTFANRKANFSPTTIDSTTTLKPNVELDSLWNNYLKTTTIALDPQSMASRNGKCISLQDLGGSVPKGYLQVLVSVKGKKNAVKQFILDQDDYTHDSKCFSTAADETKTMTNYFRYNRTDSIVPFLLNLRSRGVTNNDFEFSVIIKDGQGKVLGKFPANSETLKGKIQFLKYPVIINDTISLKKSNPTA